MEKDIELNKAAESYATEKQVSIKEVRGLHGKTQLLYAFEAGAKWKAQQQKSFLSVLEGDYEICKRLTAEDKRRPVQ